MDAASKKRRGIHDQGTITKRRRERLVRVGELASYIAIASQIFCFRNCRVEKMHLSNGM